MQNNPLQSSISPQQSKLPNTTNINSLQSTSMVSLQQQQTKIKINGEGKDINILSVELGKIQERSESILSTGNGQNTKLKMINRELRNQLQLFERRLDQNIKEKSLSQKKAKRRSQVTESLELKNAHKQCDLYRKQIIKLKKQQVLNDQSFFQGLSALVTALAVQRAELQEQVKALKKLNREQEKGLAQITHVNYLALMKQYQQAKQQNRRLHNRLLKEDREQKLTKFIMSNQRRKAREAQMRQQQMLKKIQMAKEGQLQILKAKIQKDGRTLSYLLSQNARIKQIHSSFKMRCSEKQQEIMGLKEKVLVLRRQGKFGRKRRMITQVENSGDGRQMGEMLKEGEGGSGEQEISVEIRKQTRGNSMVEIGKLWGKYPRIVEAGMKKQDVYKWNHHQFNSKIKQFQVCYHSHGYPLQLNFRYQKGEPHIHSTGKLTKFCCEENNGEYVRYVRGGFKDGILQYVSVETSRGRVGSFGRKEIEGQCERFVFGELEGEYPGAFFGESSEMGINRIGCLVEREK